MRLWNLTGPDIDAADAEPWDMPLARMMRPIALRSLVRVILAGALLYSFTGVGTICGER